jgi:hypothetical protein
MLKIKKETITLSTTKLSILIAFAAMSTSFVVALFVAPQQVAEAVTTARDVICNGCIGTSDIADGAVTTSKLASGAVKPNIDTVIGSEVSIGPGTTIVAIADCPAGELVTGGGFLSSPQIRLTESSPISQGKSWAVSGFNEDSTNSHTMRAIAQCMAPSP